MPGFWISRITHSLSIFVNMTGFWMQLCKSSEYSRIPNISHFLYVSVTQSSKYTWLWLNNTLINCSDYGRILNIPGQNLTGFWICLSVPNKPRLGIWQGWDSQLGNMQELLRVLNNPEWVWIHLSNASICVTMVEYAWIYMNKQISEYSRILNLSYAIQSIRSLIVTV